MSSINSSDNNRDQGRHDRNNRPRLNLDSPHSPPPSLPPSIPLPPNPSSSPDAGRLASPGAHAIYIPDIHTHSSQHDDKDPYVGPGMNTSHSIDTLATPTASGFPGGLGRSETVNTEGSSAPLTQSQGQSRGYTIPRPDESSELGYASMANTPNPHTHANGNGNGNGNVMDNGKGPIQARDYASVPGFPNTSNAPSPSSNGYPPTAPPSSRFMIPQMSSQSSATAASSPMDSEDESGGGAGGYAEPFMTSGGGAQQRYTSVPLDGPLGSNSGAGFTDATSAQGKNSAKTGKKGGRFSKMFGSGGSSNANDSVALESANGDDRGRAARLAALNTNTSTKPNTSDPEKTGHRRLSSWDILSTREGAKTRFAIDPNQSHAGSGGDSGRATPRSASASGLRSGSSTPRMEWEGFEFNTANASVENLRFADGDVGKSKLAKSYYYLLSKSIITRWFLYIFPVLVLLWIPGIIWLAGARDAAVWGTHLLWWSIWLTVLWGGWWGALATVLILPTFLRQSLGAVIPSLRAWIDIAKNVERPIALIGWTFTIWVSFTPIVINQFSGEQDSSSRSNLTTMASILFGLFLCSLVYAAEKVIVQIIAYRFHQDSYEDRIREQKLQTRGIVTLYINSHDIPGRSDTMTEADFKKTNKDPRRAVRNALRGFKTAAQATTTVIGNVATEMTGQSVLQTNSPYNRVNAALLSANKSKALSRRLFYSFRQPGADHLTINDIVRFFPDYDSAMVAFAVFDRDSNGDATRDEMDMALLQMHREKMSLSASMKDLDGAVSRLDDIFMVIVTLLLVLIMSAMITDKLTTLVTSAGTFVLGLSWLIGTTMQEILGACIFLFVKHPFDVGDRVDIDGQSYVVTSMQLMSTTFRRIDGTYTFIGNNILRDKYIGNIRRSGPIAETFTLEVDFTTDFKKLQELRDKMLVFLKSEARDYFPIFDVIVDDMPAQDKLVLKADIKYRSNWQEGALKVQRRNKWVCALKNALADCLIFGPGGAGDPAPAPADPIAYMQVPYVAPTDNNSSSDAPGPESPPPDFAAATAGGSQGAALLDHNEVINDSTGNIYDDDSPMTGGRSTSVSPARDPMTTPIRQRVLHARVPGESLEMAPRR